MYIQLILILLLVGIAALCTHGVAQSRVRRLQRLRRQRRSDAAQQDWASALGMLVAR